MGLDRIQDAAHCMQNNPRTTTYLCIRIPPSVNRWKAPALWLSLHGLTRRID